MRDNRDMFYSDYQAGGVINPMNNIGMVPNNIVGMQASMSPNINAYSYQGYNTTPNVQTPASVIAVPSSSGYYDNNYMENRILKLERQVKRLESRVTRLENLSGNTIDEITTTTDMYMI